MNKKHPVLLFGLHNRNLWLQALATGGSVGPRELARRAGIEYSHAHGIAAYFIKVGIVERAADGSLHLRRFFACEELGNLFAAIFCQPVSSPVNNDHYELSLLRIFGGRPRTLALTVLAVLGSLSEKDIALFAGVAHSTVRHVVKHFETQGIMHIESHAQERIVSLNPRFIAYNELRDFCCRLAEHVFDVSAIRALQAEIIEERASQTRETDTPNRIEGLLPFGLPEQSRLLIEITRRDIVNLGELTRLLGWSRSGVRATLQSLVTHRLVTTRVTGSGRGKKRWASLDPRHPLYRALRAYIFSLVAPAKYTGFQPRPAAFPAVGPVYRRGEAPACLIGGEIPNRIMLAVRNAQGIDERELVQRLGISRARLRRWLYNLQGAGLIVYEARPSGTCVRLDVTRQNSNKLQVLLTAAERFISDFGGSGMHECGPWRLPS